MKYVAILFGACLLAANSGCVIESTGGASGSSGSSGTAGTAGAGVGGASGSSGSAGTAGTGGTAGTAGTGGTGGAACGEVDAKCTADADCCTGKCDIAGTGVCLCNRCGEFVTPDFASQPSLCPDDSTSMTSDTTDFLAVVDCMCMAGNGCETECKDTCPVNDATPGDACITCVLDFTKDTGGNCKNQQDQCANDL